MHLTVQQFMTRSPHTIDHDRSVSDAHRLMRDNDIRHLPVLQAGKLVGIVPQRDLHMLASFKDIDPDAVPVSQAMSTEVYTVGPSASVRQIASEMATQKYGSAVVMDQAQVIGVFTTIDALGVLYGLLEVDRHDQQKPGK
jgi:acetoin utilization protein AcuB